MQSIEVAELFAGVGGFRLGLEGYQSSECPTFDMPAAGPFKTIWANQWEPPGTEATQFAWRCYERRFGKGSCINEDINKVLDDYEAGTIDIPDVDMVVGGFPCQDYSVAKPLSQAGGIEGRKGVLWWDIYRFLHLKEPRFVLLENVDRLLKSPASQRGRDFAIMLSCLSDLGYSVEWRVINSAEYGFPQRRKRVYIYAELTSENWDLETRISHGVLSSAFPIQQPEAFSTIAIPHDPYVVTQSFNVDGKGKSPFGTSGAMQDFQALTCDAIEYYEGERKTLGDVIVPPSEVPESFYIPKDKLEKWRYLKGSKSEERTNRQTGFTYRYSEGSMAFPDLLANPSRTILTGEGGAGASRFKHVVEIDGRYRRLVPDELERLQGFPKGWTATGMSDGRRAFCMGNALVVGIPHRIGREIAIRQQHTIKEERMTVCLIEYPKCSTCKKARSWLESHGIAFESRNIVEQNPTAEELRRWHQASGLPIRRFFNTSGRLYREQNIKQKLDAGMTDDEAYSLLASNGMLVKRPLLIVDGTPAASGFKEADWKRALNLA